MDSHGPHARVALSSSHLVFHSLTERGKEPELRMFLSTPLEITALGGNSIGFLDRLTDRLKMGDGLKMSDFGLGDDLGGQKILLNCHPALRLAPPPPLVAT